MLPPRYAAWISDLLGGTLPEEQAATCSRCAMLADTVPEAYRFRPDAKCCTYAPTLPNFLVGSALRDMPPGPARASLERRIADPSVCTPHGVDVTEHQRSAYQALLAAETFGRAETLRCPHYLVEGGLCGLHEHRNGVCATWFCKHDRGVTGQRFWNALEVLLTLIERELSHWCACQLLYRTAPPGPPASDEQSEWLAWAPHAADYYVRSAALVAELAWPEVQVVAGPDLVPAAAAVLAAHAALEPASPTLVQIRRPPATLVPGALRISHKGPETTRVITYSDSDPLALPTDLVELLPRFDGRPTEAVLAELAREGVILTPDLVERLVDFAVLRAT